MLRLLVCWQAANMLIRSMREAEVLQVVFRQYAQNGSFDTKLDGLLQA